MVGKASKLLQEMEGTMWDMSALRQEAAALKEEREQLEAALNEHRDTVNQLTKRDEEQAKELDRLKGNVSIGDYTLDQLVQLEQAIEEGRRKVTDARVAMQVSVEEKKKKECVLCFDEQKDTVFVPCGHLACCRG
jgi:chromosome segregation ATPase